MQEKDQEDPVKKFDTLFDSTQELQKEIVLADAFNAKNPLDNVKKAVGAKVSAKKISFDLEKFEITRVPGAFKKGTRQGHHNVSYKFMLRTLEKRLNNKPIPKLLESFSEINEEARILSQLSAKAIEGKDHMLPTLDRGNRDMLPMYKTVWPELFYPDHVLVLSRVFDSLNGVKFEEYAQKLAGILGLHLYKYLLYLQCTPFSAVLVEREEKSGARGEKADKPSRSKEALLGWYSKHFDEDATGILSKRYSPEVVIAYQIMGLISFLKGSESTYDRECFFSDLDSLECKRDHINNLAIVIFYLWIGNTKRWSKRTANSIQQFDSLPNSTEEEKAIIRNALRLILDIRSGRLNFITRFPIQYVMPKVPSTSYPAFQNLVRSL